LSGEDLLVMVNDGLRTASIDYSETFGGPKAKIQIIRDLPPNTRIRFRVQSSFGSAIASRSSSTDLQGAYNAGNQILETTGRPVTLITGSPGSSLPALAITGSIGIDGRSGPNVVGGIFGPQGPDVDQAFVIGRESNKPEQVWAGEENVKTHSSFTGSAAQTITAADVTTNNSSRVMTGSAVNIDLTSGTGAVMRVKASIIMRDSANGGSAGFTIEGLFERDATLSNAYAVDFPVTTVLAQGGNGVGTAVAFGLAPDPLNPSFFGQVVVVLYGASAATQYWVAKIESQLVSGTS
jgi:hypothetical protein